MRKLIFFVLILSSSIVRSEELKLSCNIELVTQYETGEVEKQRLKEVFLVNDMGEYKSIIPSSDNFFSVMTHKSPWTESFLDLSDPNKWDITNVVNYSNGSSSRNSIRIDRNLGKIWSSQTTELSSKRTIIVTGSGDCEKINVKKKKF